MDPRRIAIIVGMGLVTYLLRAVPQLFFAGRSFPEAFERYLRYLSYALIASIVSTSLFLAGPRFEAAAAPHRALALTVAVFVASWTGQPLLGMLIGALLAQTLPWLSAAL
jgi:branched-subunit amino acid transport protein